jgi:murein DD-endopeptidase MepM/ murein hydrolase activator NlpD
MGASTVASGGGAAAGDAPRQVTAEAANPAAGQAAAANSGQPGVPTTAQSAQSANPSASRTLQQRASRSQRRAAAPAPTPLATWVRPAVGPVTSGFGFRDFRGAEDHPGIDFGAPFGSTVVAASAGTVLFAGWNSGYGYLVVIDHGGGLHTRYGHNSTLLVQVGEKVSAGEPIARSGSTGDSTGPHVHFEVRLNSTNETFSGVAVDPAIWMRDEQGIDLRNQSLYPKQA